MFTAQNGNTAKCINAWTGLLIIFIVCLVVSIAVFVQFNTPSGRNRRTGVHSKPKSLHAAPVAQTRSWNSATSSQQSSNSIVF